MTTKEKIEHLHKAKGMVEALKLLDSDNKLIPLKEISYKMVYKVD